MVIGLIKRAAKQLPFFMKWRCFINIHGVMDKTTFFIIIK